MADSRNLTAALLLSLLVVYSDALTTSRQQPHSPTHWFRVFLHDVFPAEENEPRPAGASMTSPDPPPHTEHARMARYILHQSGTGSSPLVHFKHASEGVFSSLPAPSPVTG